MLELSHIDKYYNPGSVNEMCLFQDFNLTIPDSQFALQRQGLWKIALHVFVRAIVGFQIHLLDFAHQRIAGVGAGALIVEGLFHHLIQRCPGSPSRPCRNRGWSS